MLTNNDTKRLAYCMDAMLRQDDIDYLENLRLEALKLRQVFCKDCGIEMFVSTQQTRRCKKCSTERNRAYTRLVPKRNKPVES